MKYILLHGLGQNASSWNEILNTMSNQWDILCPNLVDWLQEGASCYESLYRSLESYCEQFNEPITLCGLSLGGILALQYTIDHPDRVHALVLIGTQYAVPKKLLRMQNVFFQLMPSSMFLKMGLQKSDFISLCKSMMNLDFTHHLKEIGCPVLVICGQKDKLNHQASLRLKKAIPYAKLVMIAGAGHEVNIDAPIKLGNELARFFQQTLS